MCPPPQPLKQPLGGIDVEAPPLSSKSIDSGVDVNSYTQGSALTTAHSSGRLSEIIWSTPDLYSFSQRAESPSRSPKRLSDALAEEWATRRPRSFTSDYHSLESQIQTFSSSAPAPSLNNVPESPFSIQDQKRVEQRRKADTEQASAERRQKWIEKLVEIYNGRSGDFRTVSNSTQNKIRQWTVSHGREELSNFGSIKRNFKMRSPIEMEDYLFNNFRTSPVEFEIVCKEVLARIEEPELSWFARTIGRTNSKTAATQNATCREEQEQAKQPLSGQLSSATISSGFNSFAKKFTESRPNEGTPVMGLAKNKTVPSRPGSSRSDAKHVTIPKRPEANPVKAWNLTLPWLQQNFDEILGPQNRGAIELKQAGPDPIISITAENTKSVNKDHLHKKLREFKDLHFQVEVLSGIVRRTGKSDMIGSALQSGSSEKYGFLWPPNHSGFTKTVACGSSIGREGVKGEDTATFGGFVELKFDEMNPWMLFGVTAHHLIEDRTEKTPVGKGVFNGKMNDDEFWICQPALPQFSEEKYRLCRYHEIQEATYQEKRSALAPNEKKQLIKEMESLSRQLEAINKIAVRDLRFGKVSFSSGYGETEESHQMDWALIGDIPEERSQRGNLLPGGNASTFFYKPGDQIEWVARDDFFENVEELYQQVACRNVTPPESCARVHGRGASSGAQSGYLSGTRSLVKLGEYDRASIECSFAPYNRLGMSGDSGSWIFNDFGAAVGMIIGRNDTTNLTYFTPMKRIFENIKRRTGAIDVRIANFAARQDSQWEYELLNFPFSSEETRDSGIALSARSRSSFLTTNSTTTIEEEAGTIKALPQQPRARQKRVERPNRVMT